MASTSKQLAFCEAHKPGLCSLAYLPAAAGSGGSGAATLVTSGPDGRLCYRSADAPSEVAKEAENSNNGAPTAVHCLAAAAGRPVVTGDDQNFVKVRGVEVCVGVVRCGAVYTPCHLAPPQPPPTHPPTHPNLPPARPQCFAHPGGDMDAVATRFTLPVRALAFSPSGLNLAAGGDDAGIKLVDISTCKIFRQLPSQVGGWGGGGVGGACLDFCACGLLVCGQLVIACGGDSWQGPLSAGAARVCMPAQLQPSSALVCAPPQAGLHPQHCP